MYTETKVSRVRIPWTGDGSGNAVVTTGILYGTLLSAEIVNGTGSAIPDVDYAMTLLNDNGTDMFSGQATGLPNNANTKVVGGCPIKDGTTTGTLPWPVCSALSLHVSGGGIGKTGTVFLYFR